MTAVEALLLRGSLAAIGDALRRRQVSSAEITKFFLARVETIDRRAAINAVRSVSPRAAEDARAADAELATGRDRGPLHGIPVLLKDNIFTGDGLRASAGALVFAGFIPAWEATIARRLRAAGAIILGKTNMTEFADYVSDIMPSAFSAAGGVVRNPHGEPYGRGQGSSVGSCAAVAAALAPVAIGTETQNSIQTTASHSSVVGVKPSVGAVSRAGIVPLVPSQDSPGPIVRCVADAAMVLDAIVGPDPRDTATLSAFVALRHGGRRASLDGVRIGVPRRAIADRAEFESDGPSFAEVLQHLASSGATIIDPCEIPSAEQMADVRSSVFRTEFKAALNAFLADNGSPGGIATMADLIAWNEANPGAIPYGQSLLLAASEAGDMTSPAYRNDRARDLALSRTAGIDAALAMTGAHVLIAPMGAAAKLTGKAGCPVVAIPVGRGTSGMPFGITLFSSFGRDADLIQIAAAVDAAVGQRLLPSL